MSWLYRYEAKGIQEYILATEKLAEMLGASALIEDLATEARGRAEGLGGTFIAGAAGSATFEFADAATLQGFAATWPMRVAQLLPGLKMVQAWAEVSGGRHGEVLRDEVLPRLETERNRPLVELPEAGPLIARARRTGRPALFSGRREEDGLRDAATQQKAENSSEARGCAARSAWARRAARLRHRSVR